ncbi:MAG: NFACT RNA binding domain-containing protein [Cytophagaceae bacterium]|jgi:hypothetical protein|nr:NFACT RNA binding domain-containing protein [Cytophagaceae bacterium]
MPADYLLLHALAERLSTRLVQASFREAFAWSDEEVYLCFDTPTVPVYLKCIYTPYLQLLLPVDEVDKPRHNVRPYFSAAAGLPVERVYHPTYDRSLVIELMDGSALVFKLYGSRVNVLYVKNALILERVQPKLDKTPTFDLERLNKTTPPEDLQHIPFPATTFYIDVIGSDIRWAYTPSPHTVFTGTDIEEALQAYQRYFFSVAYLQIRKTDILQQLQKDIHQHRSFILKTQGHYDQLKALPPPNQLADVIMANLHAWQGRERTARVYDFYSDQEIEIEIKAQLTPQRYAEQLYKKSKNRHLQFQKLESLLTEREQKIQALLSEMEVVQQAASHKELSAYSTHKVKVQKVQAEQELPFKTTIVDHFHIWIGKNAANNELLTLKYAHKEDLWLHARDVSGSHVVIKHQPGKSFPMHVIERAAQIAAFYSQRKTDSLCPVSYTFKKYVRKVKGTPIGSVRVEREDVVMVVPSAEI